MANTLKFGNGQWATKEGSTLAYNSENNNFKPLPFNFTRNSSATRINKEGLIEVVSNNEPRIDFKDSSEGALLLEPSRTNLITYSEDFSQWAIQSATINSNETISPDGTNNADKFTRTASNNNLRFITSISGNYTFSTFLKADTKNWVLLYINYSGGTDGQTYVDLENGIIGNEVGTDNKIEDFGNGWFKVSITFNTPATLSDVRIVIADNNGVISGSDGSIFVWGAQLEQGSYATSYIPTSGGAVTRVAETTSQTVPSGIIGQTEGTMFIEVDFGVNDVSEYPAFFLWDGTSSNRILIQRRGNTSTLQYQVNVSNSLQVSLIGTTLIGSGTVKIAIAYKQNDFVCYLNGIEEMSDTNGITYSGALSQISFANTRHDKISQMKLYNTRLSNAQLQALTS